MNTEQKLALIDSIKHWHRNATDVFDGVGARHCALCKLYFANHCKDCPVKEHTGFSHCHNTPYSYADMLERRWRFKLGEKTNGTFRRAAVAERDFLISLLPPHDQIAVKHKLEITDATT